MTTLGDVLVLTGDPDTAMERYASGDVAAFGEVYDHVAPRLHAWLLRRTRDQRRTEDLVQQTFLQMHRARGAFIPGAPVLPWAYAIAHRLLIDTVRRDGREPPFEETDLTMAVCGAAAVDDVMHAAHLAARVARELERIPETQRVAYELVRQEDLSLRQAAEALGTTVAAVKLRAHRAYEALRGALTDDTEDNR